MIENILKAINLANLDGIKDVEISVDDLLALRSHILELEDNLKKQKRDISILDAKYQLRDIDRPINLMRVYA